MGVICGVTTIVMLSRMICCSCPPCLEADTHLLRALCGVVVASSSYGCLTFSLYLLIVGGIIAEKNRDMGRGECRV